MLYVRAVELIAENGLGQRKVVTQFRSPQRNFRSYTDSREKTNVDLMVLSWLLTYWRDQAFLWPDVATARMSSSNPGTWTHSTPCSSSFALPTFSPTNFSGSLTPR